MYNTNNNKINLTKVDKLVVYLDDALKHVPEMDNVYSRTQFSIHARRTLYKIWNFAHGLDIDYFTDDGSPTPLDNGGC